MRFLNRKNAILALVVIVFMVFAIFTIYSSRDFSENRVAKRIAIIVYGNDTERWENLRQGAILAASDFDAEINLITMASSSDYEEQIELIKREVADGVDGILLAACDSKEIGQFLDESSINIPIIMVENGVTGTKQYECISADDYNMGYELGQSIIKRENPIIKAAVISDGTQRQNIVMREKGVRDAIEDYAKYVITWERNENEQNVSAKTFIQRELIEEAVDVIIALDNGTADALMDALDNLNMKKKVYVISTSDQSVYNLDQGNIKVVEYQTEFGMGYVGAYYILDEKTAKQQFSGDIIEYKVVDKDDMYSYDNQKVLFPFAK